MEIKEIIKDCPMIEIEVEDDLYVDEQGHVCLRLVLKDKKEEE